MYASYSRNTTAASNVTNDSDDDRSSHSQPQRSSQNPGADAARPSKPPGNVGKKVVKGLICALAAGAAAGAGFLVVKAATSDEKAYKRKTFVAKVAALRNRGYSTSNNASRGGVPPNGRSQAPAGSSDAEAVVRALTVRDHLDTLCAIRNHPDEASRARSNNACHAKEHLSFKDVVEAASRQNSEDPATPFTDQEIEGRKAYIVDQARRMIAEFPELANDFRGRA